MNKLLVSVIVPTYNRKESLLCTLESLHQQTYPASAYEVIIVDDGGHDGTETIATHHFHFSLQYVRQPNQGDAIARNTGALQANGAILIFLDDDITVVSNFIESIVEAHQVGDHCIVVGTLRPILSKKATLFELVYTQVRFDESFLSSDIDFTGVFSGILSVQREDYLALGMMQPLNEAGSNVWCDMEFAYRACQQGYVFRRSLTAVGYHDDYVFRDLKTHCQRMRRAGKYAVLLLHRYPELEKTVPLFRDRSFADLRKDPWSIILRKLWRSFMARPESMYSLERSINYLERRGKKSALLRKFYIWYVSNSVTIGIRQGIREFGVW